MKNKVKNVITTVIIAVLLILVVVIGVKRIVFKDNTLFGHQLFYVSSGSMEPTIMTGELILCEDVEQSELSVGDIVTYVSQNQGTLGMKITHRIVSIEQVDGKYMLTTRGDYPGLDNDVPFSAEYVVGRYVCTLKVLGFIYRLFLTPWGLVIFAVPLVAMMASEVVSIVKQTKQPEEDEQDKEKLKQEFLQDYAEKQKQKQDEDKKQ